MPAGDRPRRTTRTASDVDEKTKSGSSKKGSSPKKVKDEKTENDVDDLIDSDDESSDDEISKPWLKKRSLEEANRSIKKLSPSEVPKVPLGIPKKKKEEDHDESGNIKTESTTSLIANIPRPIEQSLIANMKPVQAKHQTLTAWKSKEEYQTFKSGKSISKTNINPALPQQRETFASTAVTTVQAASTVPENTLSRERTRLLGMESKIHNDLSSLIPYVLDSESMTKSDTVNVTAPSYLSDILNQTLNKSENTLKHGVIDWVRRISTIYNHDLFTNLQYTNSFFCNRV